MSTTLDIGDQRTFEHQFAPAPGHIQCLLISPTKVVTHLAVTMTGSSAQTTARVTPPTFTISGGWTLRWNAYVDASDALPVESVEDEIQVRRSPFPNPVAKS